MVKKILAIFNKEFANLNEAALLLAVATLGSQILGLVRDRIFAGTIGPGETLDIYYAAFRIPDLLFVTIASLASVTVLAPRLAAFFKKGEEGTLEARKFLGDACRVFALFLISISCILFFVMPLLAPLIAPGFSPEATDKLIAVSRIMLLSPFLLGLSNLLASVTQLFKRFFVYALAPLLYNTGIIIGALVFYPIFGIGGLAIGVLLGALLHFLVQLPTLFSLRMQPILFGKISWKSLGRTAFLSLPRTITLALTNIALLAIVAIASTVGEGSISRMQFAYNLQSVPIAIIGLSYSVAAFPALTELFVKGDRKAFSASVGEAFRQIIFWSAPVAVLFIVLRAHIVRVILGGGAFTWNDTKLTAAAFAIFVVSVVANSLLILIIRAYYAAGETWRPLAIGVFSTLFQIGAAFFFVHIFADLPGLKLFLERFFRVEGSFSTEMLMLPLAYTLGELINYFLLWSRFKKDHMFKEDIVAIKRTARESFAAAIVGGCITYGALRVLDPFFSADTFFGIFLQGSLSGILGLIGTILILRFMKNEELEKIRHVLKKKFWKSEVITPTEHEVHQI